MDLATNSAGLYYSAEDDSALYEVFEAINNKLSNSFKAIYERPKQMSPSDVPMISFVIDISGSMYSDDNDACGWRLDDVKNVFHDFVQDLPDEAQLQLMTFNSSVQIEQSSTTDKTRILRGLGDLFAAGGTEILTSIVAGYETLDMMPTTNKVLVYLTDAALGVDSSDKEMFDETLEEMKEKNMNVLWVGLGMEEDSPEFVYAAEKKSGGQYVVSEDVDVLREAFDDVLRTVKETKTAENTNVRINIEKVSDTGRVQPLQPTSFKCCHHFPLAVKWYQQRPLIMKQELF